MVDKIQKLRFLQELYKDSKQSINLLADRLHLSRQTISKLKKDLWDREIVHSPRILINPIRLNLQFFFMEIKTNPSEPEILNKLLSFREITGLDGILGEYSLIAKFEVLTKNDFSNILKTIDQGITQSIFQSYRIIETIDIYKIGGFIIDKSREIYQIEPEKWNLLQLLRKNYNLKKWPERHPHEFFSDEETEYLKKINLSREFDRFDSEGIIQRYSYCLSRQLPDFTTKFYLRIKPKTIGEYVDLANALTHNPNIIDLYRTGEDAGLLAVVRTNGLDGFTKFIKRLYSDYSILNTHTTVVVESHIADLIPPTLDTAKNLTETSTDYT